MECHAPRTKGGIQKELAQLQGDDGSFHLLVKYWYVPRPYLSLPSFGGNVQSGIRSRGSNHAPRNPFVLGHLLHVTVIAGGILSLLNHLVALLDTIRMNGILGIQARDLFFPLHGRRRRRSSSNSRRCRHVRLGRRTLATETLGLGHFLGAAMTLQMRSFALGFCSRVSHCVCRRIKQTVASKNAVTKAKGMVLSFVDGEDFLSSVGKNVRNDIAARDFQKRPPSYKMLTLARKTAVF